MTVNILKDIRERRTQAQKQETVAVTQNELAPETSGQIDAVATPEEVASTNRELQQITSATENLAAEAKAVEDPELAAEAKQLATEVANTQEITSPKGELTASAQEISEAEMRLLQEKYAHLGEEIAMAIVAKIKQSTGQHHIDKDGWTIRFNNDDLVLPKDIPDSNREVVLKFIEGTIDSVLGKAKQGAAYYKDLYEYDDERMQSEYVQRLVKETTEAVEERFSKGDLHNVQVIDSKTNSYVTVWQNKLFKQQ